MNELKSLHSSKKNLNSLNKNQSTSSLHKNSNALYNSCKIKSSKAAGLNKNGYLAANNVPSSLKKKFGSGSPQFSFGMGPRIKGDFVEYMSQTQAIYSKDVKEFPAPGDYNPKPEQLKKAASSWTLPGKDTYRPANLNPGPGMYNTNNTPNKKNAPSIKFGSSKKEFSLVEKIKDKANIPGPNNYSSSKDFGKGGKLYSFGKEGKFCDKRPLTPGPGHYNSEKSSDFKNKIGSAKTTFGNEFNNTIYKFNNNPGPGFYNTIHANKAKGPSHRIGTAKRKDEFLNVVNNSPGPGLYNYKSTVSKAISFKFLQDEKLKPIKSSTPGPGEYDI